MKTKMTENLDTEAIVLDTLLRRRSTRAFDPSPVPAWKLRRVFEAARWAPSSFNEQPWRFIVTTDEQPAGRQKLLESLYESNRVWAKDAPVLILAAASTVRSRTGQINRHATCDLGQSVANLSTEATALGLAVHQIGGFNPETVRSAFQLPDEVVPVVVIALGAPGDPLRLPERLGSLESSPRTRKAVTEMVFYGKWPGPSVAEVDLMETHEV